MIMHKSPSASRLLLVATIVTLIAGSAATAWLLRSRERERRIVDPEIAAGRDNEMPTLQTPHDPELATPAIASLPSDAIVGRATLETPLYSLRVQDDRGRPVSGAEVEWIIPAAPDYSALKKWRMKDWVAMDAKAVIASSDARGIAQFASVPSEAEQRLSVLWVTHDGFAAEPMLVEQDRGKWSGDHVCELKASPPLQVRVIGADDRPVAGAIVDVIGAGITPSPPPGSWLTRASSAFHRRGVTDEEGAWSFAPMAGEHFIWAVKDERISLPSTYVSIAASPVVIRLEPSFWADGRVSFVDGAGYDPSIQVSIYRVRGQVFDMIHQAAIVGDGSFGPVLVPLPAEGDYVFGIGGGEIVPVFTRRAHPDEGERVHVDFTVAGGSSFAVRVEDEARKPIHDAVVSVTWNHSDGAGRTDAFTNEEGLGILHGCPAGDIWLRVQAPGYVKYEPGEFELTKDIDQPLAITLEKAGPITGRVRRAEKPVRDFTLTFWKEGHVVERTSKTVTSSADGRFEIDEAPLGNVLLYALSTDCPRSQVHVLHTDSASVATVEIELPEPIVGRGRIVDSASGDGIASAQFRLYMTYCGNYLDAFGAPRPVDADGRFEIKGFPPGESRFVAQADGYASCLGYAHGTAGEEIDLGLIALHRNQTLEVRLESATTGDFSGWQANADCDQAYPRQSFSRDGVTRFVDVGPGICFIRVFPPGEQMRAIETFLEPGREWLVRFPVAGGRKLAIQVSGTDGRSAADVGAVDAVVTHVSPQGHVLQRFAGLDGHGRASFDALPSGNATVEAMSRDGARLGATVARLDADENSAELVLGGHDLLMQVVDGHNGPLEGVTVQLRAPKLGFAWWQFGTTDTHGEVRFPSLGLPSVVANLMHAELGMRADIEIDLEHRDPDKPLVLTLDARGRVRLRCVERGTPVPGLQVRVFAEHCDFHVGSSTTDEQGKIETPPVTPGRFRYSIVQVGVWPSAGTVDSRADAGSTDVEVRRVGAIEFTIALLTGAPAVDAGVELQSVELGEQVGDWIANGLVAAPAQGLSTDAQGQLRVDGLPSGEYRWNVRAQAGESASGVINVMSHAVADVSAVARP